MRILTNFQYMRWVAVDDDTFDGPGSPMGEGKTEQAAIEDLLEILAEREERRSVRSRADE